MKGRRVHTGPSGSGNRPCFAASNGSSGRLGQIFLHGDMSGCAAAPEGSSVPMTDRELAAVRMRVGMVFQHFNLWPHMRRSEQSSNVLFMCSEAQARSRGRG